MSNYKTSEHYGHALSHIHDTGFAGVAEAAADMLISTLKASGLTRGRVTDLGCGSGILARKLLDQGYAVEGIDQSGAMLALAQSRAPEAVFRRESLLECEIPPSIAVCAIGECFNYRFDRNNDDAALDRVLHRVHQSLEGGGIFSVRYRHAGPHHESATKTILPDAKLDDFGREYTLGNTADDDAKNIFLCQGR